MKPYGERPTGNACSCCNVLRGGEDGHKRTAERMRSEREAMHDLSDYAQQREPQPSRAAAQAPEAQATHAHPTGADQDAAVAQPTILPVGNEPPAWNEWHQQLAEADRERFGRIVAIDTTDNVLTAADRLQEEWKRKRELRARFPYRGGRP